MIASPWEPSLGANVRDDGTAFRVWAPDTLSAEVVLESDGAAPEARAMVRTPDGYHEARVPAVGPGALYRYRLDGRGPFPDPATRFQPQGVHGPSQVVDWHHFPWTDGTWRGVALERTVLYELHVGTFTPEGTFAAAAARLSALAALGITAVELMPVADFSGHRNWGYDGVAPFAPARCYGTPDDLRHFVDTAHALGLAVHLDVVYNHLGPDGAYQATFSQYYYSTTHESPWGAGINFDGQHSAPVRQYVVENVLRWIREFHLDGLRLDATHAIVDTSEDHVLATLAAAVRLALDDEPRLVHLIAEDSRNFSQMVRPTSTDGWALDGLWSDDFHHHMRRALAGDRDGYFQDFDGASTSVAATIRQGWFYTGQTSQYSGAARGTDPVGIPASRFVFFLQNHDQVGNRAFGDRLHHHIDLATWRAASALLLILPETPLLFMGQEWAASTPFRYFTDHEAALGRLVTEGRRREFARFDAFADPATRARIPDPQDQDTFSASRLDWDEQTREPHASVLRLYRRLLALRRDALIAQPPVLIGENTFDAEAAGDDVVIVRRGPQDEPALLAVVRLRGSGFEEIRGSRIVALPMTHEWRVLMTTEDAAYAHDAQPPRIGIDPLHVEFLRPGAVLFECVRAGHAERA